MKLLLFLLIVIYLSNCSDPQSSNITVDFPKQKFLIKNKSLEHYLDSFIIRKCKTKSDALLLIITNDESQSLIRLKVVYNASNMRAQFITDYKGKKLFIVIPNLTNIFEFNIIW